MNNITNMIAEGKGKRLYATENPDEAVVYYRDETFAFHKQVCPTTLSGASITVAR